MVEFCHAATQVEKITTERESQEDQEQELYVTDVIQEAIGELKLSKKFIPVNDANKLLEALFVISDESEIIDT